MDGFDDVFDAADRQKEAERMLTDSAAIDREWDNRQSRDQALTHAIDFSRITNQCDPVEVVNTARAFYAFLTEE